MFTHIKCAQENEKYARAKWTGNDNCLLMLISQMFTLVKQTKYA